MADILDLNYSPELFVQMMEFLREKLENFAPLTSHYGGYTYVFKTRADKANFDRLIEVDEDAAMTYVFDKWKEGTAQIMNIELSSGYKNTVIVGQRDNVIEFTFHTLDGSAKTYEPVTVNYTFMCNGIRQTVQEQYAAREEVRFNIDNYLLEGTNTITIQVRGNNSKVASSIDVVYVMTELSVSSNFNISTEYGSGDDMAMNVVAKGSSDTGNVFVEWVVDGNHSSGELKVSADEVGSEKRLTIAADSLPVTPGKHTLQLRTRATIGNVNRYSRVWYYEWVRSGYQGQIVTIKRLLSDDNFIQESSSLTLMCEQYVTEVITYGFRSSTSDRCEVRWQLVPIGGGDATNVGSADIGSDMAGNEGRELQMSFLPVDTGRFRLVPTVNGVEHTQYDVQVAYNTSGLEEASVSDMTCRLFAIGRSNEEPDDERDVWKYKGVTTTFSGVKWNGVSGWVNNALQLTEGAKAIVNVQPFVNMSGTGDGMTIEIDFETFNVENEDATVISVGNRINITANTATLLAPTSRTSVTDKFPANQRLTLAFVVHAKNSLSQPRLMEIINTGVTSRCAGYQMADNFVATDRITIGGVSGVGVRVYGIRVYRISLNNKQELNNVIVSADDIATMVRRNDIYNGNQVEIDKIINRIPSLKVTGRGGTDVLRSIWNSQAKVQIHVDAEWSNPLDGGRTNWRCTDMRLRSHGQSTLRNPMKSLKMWFKSESGQNVHITEFYNRDETEPMADPRWAMKQGSMPLNKYIAQCYYIDSSNCKSPSLLSIIDETMRAAGIFTPPMQYALNQYPADMRRLHGEDPSGRGWKFPYDLRYTPDSIPCVLISRDTENDPWRFEGIFVLMDDKKSDYLYGLRSIYSCPDDPFCFWHDKADYVCLWDNKDTTRFEYLSNTHPLSIDAHKGVTDFFKAPQTFTPDDDEQDVTTDPSGGEDSGSSSSDATYDFEQAAELIYPDIDDLRGKKSWPLNYANANALTDLAPHANRLYQLKKWVSDCRRAQEQGDGYAKFRTEAAQHLDLDHWACYYCFAMPNGTFDNIVRNLQLTTFVCINGIYIWLPLWWDIDIQDGTINTGQLAFDPPVDRQTETVQYGVAFRGQESWLWNALEAWPDFKTRCRNIMNKLNAAGYTYEKIIAKQDEYCNTWPEAMLNESQNVKYKQMYLSNPASNARFLYYLLGDGKLFRRWWLKRNWDYWMSYLAAGDAVKNGVAARWNDGSVTVHITYGASTFFMWSINDALVTLPNGGYSQPVKRGDSVSFVPTDTSNSIYSTVYSAHYIQKADYSKNAENLLNMNLSNFLDPILGTMLEELNIGVSEEQLRAGYRNGASGVVEGWGALVKVRHLNVQGYTAGEALDLTASTQLTHLYARGSAFTTILLADSIDLQKAELPTTLTIMEMRNITLGDVKFYDPDSPYASSSVYPTEMTNAAFYGMGNQDSVRRLVMAWLRGNSGQEQDLSLTITNLAWTECSYEDIMLMGMVPRERRNYQGKVKITTIGGEDRNLTNAEMNALSNAFNDPDRGINVFSVNSSFQIDLRAGVILSGPSEVWAGETAQIIGAVFPLTAGGYQFRYEIGRINGSAPSSSIGVVDGWQTYRNVRLNVTTGTIATTETSDPTVVLDIICTAYSLSATMEPQVFSIEVNRRIYPKALTIEGTQLIQSTGEFNYAIAYTPSGINGTYTTHQWSLQGGNDQIRLSSSRKGSAKLYVGEIISDIDIRLAYYEEYVGNGRTTASPITVSLVYNANEQVLIDFQNHEVFQIFLRYGQQNPDYQLSSLTALTRIEARRYMSLPPEFSDPDVAGAVTHFQEIQHFKNLTSTVDLSHTSLRDEVLDLTQLSKVTGINTQGTYASIKL